MLGLFDANKRIPQDPWTASQYRFNQLVTVRLRDKATQKSFAVGNYHMPCAYYEPRIMTIHADLAARHVQRLASKPAPDIESDDTEQRDTEVRAEGMPYVLAGDFNIKPGLSSYRLLTTGTMDKGDPEWPSPKHGMEWSPSCQAMRSAYAVAGDGEEPDMTNYSRVREEEPFIDTLDYIFLSDEWRVNGVRELPHRDDANGPFPNLEYGEPSDHVMIAADLEL